MRPRGWLYWLVVAIAMTTLVSGVGQLIAPRVVLAFVAAQRTPTSAHFFAIVGMFMALFGCLLLHGLVSSVPNRVAILWAGLQKFGAVAAVGLGVQHGIFSSLALVIAAFDLFSGVAVILYWREAVSR